MEPGEYPQGLWTYPDFPTYLDQWIKLYMLKDLETVFEGACERWKSDNMPENGRGDFVLATALFALFDHLGAFLSEDQNSSFQARENIARVSRLLPSTKDVDLIVAHFGRNALIHGAWPQTTVMMDSRSWAFGLNISADPRPINEHGEPTHNYLYRRRYPLPRMDGNSILLDILKMRLNVRVLRYELEEAITTEDAFRKVKQEVFNRVKELAINSCDLDYSKSFSQQRSPGKGHNPTSNRSIKDQIYDQLKKAKQQGIW